MAMLQVKDIGECINGFTFRGKPRDDARGDIRVIQVGDLQLDGTVNTLLSPRIKRPANVEKFVLSDGDIVFRGRAGTAAALVAQSDMPLMVASPLVIIRINKKQTLPGYLTWYLNSQKAARYFNRSSQGTLIKAVGIKELAQLRIPIPSLAKQERIIEAANLLQKEQNLLQEISSRKEKLVMQALLGAAHNDTQKRKSA